MAQAACDCIGRDPGCCLVSSVIVIGHQTGEREVRGWNLGQTNTQGLKITEDKGTAFIMMPANG